VKSVTQALIQSERYGTPIAQALQGPCAGKPRCSGCTEAEKKAAALPPKLTVPMILFFLPVLIGVILGPGRDPGDGQLLGRRAAVTRHLVLQIWMAWQSAAGNSVRRRFPHPIRLMAATRAPSAGRL
jgi:pilus assembly protein TadC